MMSACNRAFWVFVTFASPASAQTISQLIPHQVKLESVDYLGKRAIKITEDGQVRRRARLYWNRLPSTERPVRVYLSASDQRPRR